LIHKESVCAVFGAGASDACVVDLGETKTTLSVVEDGECVSRSELPYGGIHISKTLLWLLKQCNFPLSDSVSFDNLADQQNLERIRNEYCHLEEANEIFQQVDFIHNKQIYMMDIGDPLLLAPLAYFYPKLFGRECKLPETEQDPYAEIENDNFWTEECLKALHEQSLEPPSKKARLGKNKKKATGNKKGKKTTKKLNENKEEAVATEEANKATKGKLKTALALHRAIVRLIKSSEMDVESKTSKKKTISINILLIGGLSHIKGFKTALEKRLIEHYNNKNESKQVKFTILTNDRDRNMDVRFLSWNGGLILSRVEASKKLWITKKDYLIYREHVIDEKCAFVL
jgi:actin-related protein 8